MLHFPKLALLQPAPLRKRLWQAGMAALLVLLIFVVGNFLIRPEKSVTSRMLGHDFLAFYTAGDFARQHQFDRLYDLDAVRQNELALAARYNLEIGPGFGPYWNPPFYALALAPLTALPYPQALSVWTAVNLACFVTAILMLIRMLPAIVAHPPRAFGLSDDPLPLKFGRDWRNFALVPLLICVSMPFIQALSHGQNTFISLLLLTLVASAWRNRMPVAAGLACGLLLYKPQLAVVVATMLILSLGIRVCLGLGFIAGLFLLITSLTMHGSLGTYLYQLPLNLQAMQVEQPYLWERHVTLKAFWRLLFQGRGAADTSALVDLLTFCSCGLVALGLAGVWWRTRKPGIDDVWTGQTRSLARDRVIGATLTAMPLLMPFYFDYDLLLLCIPAVLFAGEILAQAPGSHLDRLQRLLIGSWIALDLWLFVNPPLAAGSCVNVSVLLLGTVCALSILRACTPGVRTSSLIMPQIQHVTVKRAA